MKYEPEIHSHFITDLLFDRDIVLSKKMSIQSKNWYPSEALFTTRFQPVKRLCSNEF